MLFVNRVAHILHSISAHHGGVANKNVGDAFLIMWKFRYDGVVKYYVPGTY